MSFTFYVFDEVTLSIPTIKPGLVCGNDGFLPITLYPPGGNLSINTLGLMITSNESYVFNPSLSETGNYTLQYSVEAYSPVTCSISQNLTFEIYQPVVPKIIGITPNSSICSNSAPITLETDPPGGTFSGIGVSGNEFNPNVVTQGLVTIYYQVPAGNGCFSRSSVSFEVYYASDCVILLPTQSPIRNALVIGLVVGIGGFFICVVICYYSFGKIQNQKKQWNILN